MGSVWLASQTSLGGARQLSDNFCHRVTGSGSKVNVLICRVRHVNFFSLLIHIGLPFFL